MMINSNNQIGKIVTATRVALDFLFKRKEKEVNSNGNVISIFVV